MSFVLTRTGLIPRVDQGGKALVEVLRALTIEKGIKVGYSTWPIIDCCTGDIYLHTTREYGLRVFPGGIEKKQPPIVVDGRLCRCLEEDLFVPFDGGEVSDPAPGLELLKELLLDNLAAPVWGRYLAVGWLFSRLLIGDFSSSIMLRMGGESTKGKTTALELLSVLFYGEHRETTATQAAMFSAAQREPFLFLDNLESDKVRSGLPAARFPGNRPHEAKTRDRLGHGARDPPRLGDHFQYRRVPDDRAPRAHFRDPN